MQSESGGISRFDSLFLYTKIIDRKAALQS